MGTAREDRQSAHALCASGPSNWSTALEVEGPKHQPNLKVRTVDPQTGSRRRRLLVPYQANTCDFSSEWGDAVQVIQQWERVAHNL